MLLSEIIYYDTLLSEITYFALMLSEITYYYMSLSEITFIFNFYIILDYFYFISVIVCLRSIVRLCIIYNRKNTDM